MATTSASATTASTTAPPAAPPKPVKPVPTFAEPTAEQESLLESAEKAIDDENFEAAIQAFEMLSKSEPMSGHRITGMIALADLYLQGGETSRAVAVLEDAKRLAPPRPEVLFVLGRAYKQAGKPKASLVVYLEALQLQPLLLRAYVEIGGLYAEMGQPEDSKKAMHNYEREVYKYAKLLEAGDTHPTDKFKIVEAFSMLPDDRVSQSLVIAMDDAIPVVRLAAAEALGEVGSEDVVPALRKAVEKATANGDKVMVAMLRQSIARITKTPVPKEDTETPREDGKVGPTFVPPGEKSTAPIDPKAPAPNTPKVPAQDTPVPEK